MVLPGVTGQFRAPRAACRRLMRAGCAEGARQPGCAAGSRESAACSGQVGPRRGELMKPAVGLFEDGARARGLKGPRSASRTATPVLSPVEGPPLTPLRRAQRPHSRPTAGKLPHTIFARGIDRYMSRRRWSRCSRRPLRSPRTPPTCTCRLSPCRGLWTRLCPVVYRRRIHSCTDASGATIARATSEPPLGRCATAMA